MFTRFSLEVSVVSKSITVLELLGEDEELDWAFSLVRNWLEVVFSESDDDITTNLLMINKKGKVFDKKIPSEKIR